METERNCTEEQQPNRLAFILLCRLNPQNNLPGGKTGKKGCLRAFTINVRRMKGIWKCPHEGCGKKTRADLRNGGSAAVFRGPYASRAAAKRHSDAYNASLGPSVADYDDWFDGVTE